MSRPIPTSWPDIDAWVLPLLRAAFPALTVGNRKPAPGPDLRALVVRSDYGQRVTPLSRYVRLGIQSWVTTSAQEARTDQAFDQARDAGAFLETLDPDGSPLLSASVDSGPIRVEDPESGLEYAYTVVLLEVQSA